MVTNDKCADIWFMTHCCFCMEAVIGVEPCFAFDSWPFVNQPSCGLAGADCWLTIPSWERTRHTSHTVGCQHLSHAILSERAPSPAPSHFSLRSPPATPWQQAFFFFTPTAQNVAHGLSQQDRKKSLTRLVASAFLALKHTVNVERTDRTMRGKTVALKGLKHDQTNLSINPGCHHVASG